MTNGPRWRHRPPGSNWGDFGPDDQLGRVNLIDRGRVLAGVAEVQEGLTFCLSLPLDVGYWLNPGRRPPKLREVEVEGGLPMMNYPLRRMCSHFTDVTCDDAVSLDLQFSTQWDALGHVGSAFDADGDGVAEIVYYNGYRGHEHIVSTIDYRGAEPAPGAKEGRLHRLAVDTLAVRGLQGRGVLIDLHHHFGGAPRSVGYRDLMHVLDSDRIEISPGDMVCVRTGIDDFILDNVGRTDMPAETPGPSLDGRDDRLLEWITQSGLACLVSDHPAVETYPPRPGPEGAHPHLPLHEHCLFKLGIPLGELWRLSPLAEWLRANGRSHFLLTAPPLRLPGAAGSPVTPLATV